MDILRSLFDQLDEVVIAFNDVASFFSLPLSVVAEEYPFLSGLVGRGFFQVITSAYPDVTLFKLMFTTALIFTIVYSFIKWLLDIIL